MAASECGTGDTAKCRQEAGGEEKGKKGETRRRRQKENKLYSAAEMGKQTVVVSQ